MAPSDDLISKAAIILKEIYNKRDESKKLDDKEEKEETLKKFGPIFSLDNIDSLQYKQVDEFAEFNKNHHWTHLKRNIKYVRENFDGTKKALKILVDPKHGPVKTRLLDARQLSKGMGPAFLTAILYVEFPDSCAVLNETTYNVLKDLGLVNFSSSNNNLIKNYSSVNDIILKLKELTGLDLWELDWAFNDYQKIDQNAKNINQNKPRWFVEKTNQATHNIQSVPNTGIGEILRSPKADAKGRDIYHEMTEINPGDYIIHLVMDKNNSITGVSMAKEKASSFVTPPGNLWPGDNFVVKLEGFTKLSPPLKWSEIKEKEKNRLIQLSDHYKGRFYNEDLGLHMGAYLSAAPEELVSIINDVYMSKTGKNIPYFTSSASAKPKPDAASNQSEEVQKNMPKNMILHGPVGTGKTFYATLLARGLINNKISGIKDIESLLSGDPEKVNFLSNLKSGEQIKTVTFHQSYGYEDFIGGIKAVTGGNGNIEYKVVPGVFKTLCDTARKDINKPYVIIIDEINRGDISRIFGELITLIEDDKRSNKYSEGITIKLPNFDEEFSVPENVYIIGTMNDSDKSIALLDVALRRRFLFFLVPPDSKIIEGWINEKIKDEKFKNIVIDLFNMLNKSISETKGEDFIIGHAFFKELKDTDDDPYETLRQIFLYKIIPLLKEIYYGRDEILYGTVLKGKFFKRIEGSENVYYQIIAHSLDSTGNFESELNNMLYKKDD